MPPKERSANFKTYEAQSRLLAALVASLEGHRFDYKKIAQYHGGGVTESAMEHKFRLARAQAELIKVMVANDRDPGDYDIPNLTKAEIQKFFGASTPDGVGFQFRGIKRGSDVLKAAVENGDDPVDAFARFLKGGSSAAGSAPATPSTTKRARTTKAAAPGSGATPSSKRHKAIKIEPGLDDDEDSPEIDYSELDATPTKTKAKPARSAQIQAKSAPGTMVPTPRHVPIAPAPPRSAAASPAPPSYNLAPIPGFASASLPNGYTNMATGLGYNVMAPPTSMDSAAPSTAGSQAMGMAQARRGSAYSTGSYTAASSPATPNMSWQDPTPSPMSNAASVNNMHNMGDMSLNMGGQYPAVPGTADVTSGMTVSMASLDATTTMSTSSNMPSFNASTVHATPSPSESSFDMITQPTATSSRATGAATPGMYATAKSTEASQEFLPLQGYGSASRHVAPVDGHSSHSNSGGYSNFDQHEAELAAQVDFGGFEVQDEASDYDDAGEI
ncbi:uncharacterized protein P884DRAFT_268266 [Thermothelomyces heterothallicus CBS 202.75]|uniref:uncharacterized protein n=1 Tax=Thermothelomyces heterothallicus CBS 202.75 TaxID=1149848 RepID=UPI00374213A1